MTNKIMCIRGNWQGRGEGRQEKHSFSKMQTAKGDGEPQVIIFMAIPHNSKCRSGERGAAAAKPKAQIILDVLSSILATQMPCRSRRSGA